MSWSSFSGSDCESSQASDVTCLSDLGVLVFGAMFLVNSFILFFISLQCFDTVSWATERASGL